jgi:predicted alpha/beta superfamily hydrolase
MNIRVSGAQNMSTARFVFILILFMGYLPTTTQAAEETGTAITVKLGQRLTLQSTVLKETREVLVHLPDGYPESQDKYPVIYLLDGGSHFQHAVTAATLLQQNEKLPPSIIVGIPNNTGKRSRDAFSERQNFIHFIAKELIPYVDTHYQTSKFKTLFGHSAMGAAALHVFAYNTNLFDYYIAASPAAGEPGSPLMKQIKQQLKTAQIANKSLFFSVTDEAGEIEGFTEGARYIEQLIKQNASKDFKWHFQFMPGQTHMTTPYMTLFQGLSKTYEHFPKLSETCLLGFCF